MAGSTSAVAVWASATAGYDASVSLQPYARVACVCRHAEQQNRRRNADHSVRVNLDRLVGGLELLGGHILPTILQPQLSSALHCDAPVRTRTHQQAYQNHFDIHRPSQSSGQCSAAVVQSSLAGAEWGSAHVEPTAQLITLAMSHNRPYMPKLCFQRTAGRHQAACKSLRVSECECDMLPSAGTCCRRPREHTYRLTTQIIFSGSSIHHLCSAL